MIAWDTETTKIRAGRLAPEMICSSFATRRADGEIVSDIKSNGDSDLDTLLETMLERGDTASIDGPRTIVGANVAFDLSVLSARRPDLLTAIFEALDFEAGHGGRIEDVIMREKLLDLATDGDLSYLRLPDGSAKPRDYSLAGLETIYLGRDRSADKDRVDAWRTNYGMLDGKPSSEWPEEAKNYAIDDAIGTLLVHERQTMRAIAAFESDRIPTEHFHVAVAFCLRLIECWGICCDLTMKEEIAAKLREELKPERMRHLLASRPDLGFTPDEVKKMKSDSVLRPAVPGRLWHGRMTKGKKESINKKVLIRLVETVCEREGIKVKRKDPTEKMKEAAEASGEEAEGNVSVDKNVLAEIAHLDPALEEYRYRQYLDKVVQALAAMNGPVIYSRYNLPMESGRTSASSSDDYPSTNIQNVSAVKTLKDEKGEPTGEVNVRECFVPRPGRLICSIDYSALEFCSMAQQCYELFGYSVMRDLINGGIDPHAYLGAQIALHQHAEFALLAQANVDIGDPLAVYRLFKSLEHDAEWKDIYKQYRKLAKPVGFGFPGGLGLKKFVGFAAAHPYYVRVTEEQARELKRIWMSTFPEMRDYFAWVESQKEPSETYTYVTKLGMRRTGCSYTEMCNGRLLQSPAAEGAKLAIWRVVRACYDETRQSVLYGQRVLAFIHDELLFELGGTRQEIHDAAHEAARLMVEAMQGVMPDVRISTNIALMTRWNKDAEMVIGPDGLLDVWLPKAKTYKKSA